MSHNIAEVIKNICCVKNEGTFDHNTIISWVKKFHSGCYNLDDQARSGRPKTVDSLAS